MTTLPEFVLARNDEREAVARAADAEAADGWPLPMTTMHHAERWDRASGQTECGVAFPAAHVLAWCETVRRIVEEWAAAERGAVSQGPYPSTEAGEADGLDLAVRLLALPDAAHADYDPAWAV